MNYDDLSDLQWVRETYGLTFELLMDTEHLVTMQYYAIGYPTNILIDQSGVINWRAPQTNFNELSEKINALLSP